MKRAYTLGKNERLKSRKSIGILFSEGKSFSSGFIKGLYILSNHSDQPLQCGFTVGTRSFKKAIDRNRIKRLMRESYRLQKKVLSEYLSGNKKSMHIFLIFRGKDIPEYTVMFETVGEILKKLFKQANENNS